MRKKTIFVGVVTVLLSIGILIGRYIYKRGRFRFEIVMKKDNGNENKSIRVE